MMKSTKHALDTAVDELKREGYMVLIVMLDQKGDTSRPMGSGVEVLCSETNDPQLLGAMLKTVMESLSAPVVADRQN